MKKIYSFTNSNFYRELQKCEKIEKEKAFCIKLMANSIFPEAENETILVQGIIDLFAIKNDEIILVDYKTDFVEKENDISIPIYAKEDIYSKDGIMIYEKNELVDVAILKDEKVTTKSLIFGNYYLKNSYDNRIIEIILNQIETQKITFHESINS